MQEQGSAVNDCWDNPMLTVSPLPCRRSEPPTDIPSSRGGLASMKGKRKEKPQTPQRPQMLRRHSYAASLLLVLVLGSVDGSWATLRKACGRWAAVHSDVRRPRVGRSPDGLCPMQSLHRPPVRGRRYVDRGSSRQAVRSPGMSRAFRSACRVEGTGSLPSDRRSPAGA